jgi:DMSO/TMAO reductase YedYZ heme-binding membrane subunit
MKYIVLRKKKNMNIHQKYAVLACRSISVLTIFYGVSKTFFGTNQITIDYNDQITSLIFTILISLLFSLIPGLLFFFLSEKIGIWIGKNFGD